MIYSVKYRKVGSFFWTKLKRVKGDSTLVAEGLSVRVFMLDDETRLEIPALTNEFVFSKERHLTVLKNMEREAGQKLPIN